MTKQNIYDDPKFYEGYQKIRSKSANANNLLVFPIFKTLIGEISGMKILDLGCGNGELAYKLAVKENIVDAVDISTKMIENAKVLHSHTNINYYHEPIEDFAFNKKYDMIISSLVLHYIDDEDISVLFSKIRDSLIPGGQLIFCIEHPSSRASRYTKWVNVDDIRVWPLTDYFEKGIREEDWITQGVVKYHRTISDYFYLLKDNNFTLIDLNESEPNEELRAIFPSAFLRPYFLFMKAVKN